MKSIFRYISLASMAFGASAGAAHGTSIAPTPPLAERVQNAELVFAGTLIERVEDGDWVRAVLRVDVPLHGVGDQTRINVIWRTLLGDLKIYDAVQGQRGIAILDDKHEERYWLRADKFEPLANIQEVRKLIREAEANRTPTFENWVKAGKPIPPGMVFTGGTPWFNETTGTQRTAEEVYEMIHGKKATPAKPPTSRFPAHWGEPPSVQTRDLRPLPGGYGRGSSTLKRWIEEKMNTDAQNAENVPDKK